MVKHSLTHAMTVTRKTREERARDRRDAILDAALKVFTAHGFADARIEDVAKLAAIAKGTVYLYFADKEALFEGVIRKAMLAGADIRDVAPVIPADMSVRQFLERELVVATNDFARSHMADVIRLLVSEGLRFPHLVAFYQTEFLKPSMDRTRSVLAEAARRGELRSPDVVDFPMLLGSPMLLGAIWHGIIGDRDQLDVPRMMQVFIDVLFKPPSDTTAKA